MSEADVAGLYLFLEAEFPSSGDPDHQGAYTPTPDDDARELRNRLLAHLRDRANETAIAQLQLIARTLPHHRWLKAVIVDARTAYLRRAWRPITPQELLQLSGTPSIGLVRNASELQNVIVDALMQFDATLRGETPAAVDLWDQTVRTRGEQKWQPKDENSLSDWVKRHLEEKLRSRGVVPLREVEIRRATGTGTGQRTDILVTASSPAGHGEQYNTVKVVIETKGCWHQELDTAMQTQLVDRYLYENSCKHGIYLVCWFSCGVWSDEPRRRATPNRTVAEARAYFADQAARLSADDCSIQAVVLDAALLSAQPPGGSHQAAVVGGAGAGPTNSASTARVRRTT